jgi:hypothetical protein
MPVTNLRSESVSEALDGLKDAPTHHPGAIELTVGNERSAYSSFSSRLPLTSNADGKEIVRQLRSERGDGCLGSEVPPAAS